MTGVLGLAILRLETLDNQFVVRVLALTSSVHAVGVTLISSFSASEEGWGCATDHLTGGCVLWLGYITCRSQENPIS